MTHDILSKSLLELIALVKAKTLTWTEINGLYHDRSTRLNPTLNAYVTILKDIHAHGPQIAVKDNFCIQGVRTTASSLLLDSFIAPYESTVTAKLKQSNILVSGKTNMDAWAHGSSTETSDYGPSLNPFDISRAPGGSSGGSATAVAAGLTVAAIGSETAGSIRLPASWCGIVGLKPTYGRVSRYGVIAMGSSLDCPGPLTKTVSDAAYMLGIIAGQDPYDATSSRAEVPDYLQEMRQNRKLRIGVAEKYFENVDESIQHSIREAIDEFVHMGHSVHSISLMDPKYAISDYTIIQRAEVSSNLGRYDGVRYGKSREAFAAEAKRRIMLGTYTLAHGYYDAYYKKAQQARTLIIRDFNRVFEEVDVIVAPTTPITAIRLGDWAKYPFFGEAMDVLAEPASMAGLPAISIPCGTDANGLPIGMQIMGNAFAEGAILDLAYQYEQQTQSRAIVQHAIELWK